LLKKLVEENENKIFLKSY